MQSEVVMNSSVVNRKVCLLVSGVYSKSKVTVVDG
jgi:hypothetical protein